MVKKIIAKKKKKKMNSTNNANYSNGKQKVAAKRISSSTKSCKQINCGIKKDKKKPLLPN